MYEFLERTYQFLVEPEQLWVSVAASVFLLVIGVILLSVSMRARAGLKAIAALRKGAPQIARSLADRRPAVQVYDEILRGLPQGRNHDLRLALSEIRAGLVRYQDDFSVGIDGRTIAHVRLTEVFQASLPERLIAVPRALAASRLIVQTGLALSVGFVLFALLQPQDTNAVTATVAFKFLFTIIGLLGSVLIQLVAGSSLRRAERAFVDLETEIEGQSNLTVVTYSAGSFALLRSLADTQAGLETLLADFRARVDDLVSGSAALAVAANSLSQTARDAAASVEAMQRAGAEIGAEVGRRIDAGTSAVREVSDAFATSLQKTAISAEAAATDVLARLKAQGIELVALVSAEAERQASAAALARQDSDAEARRALQTAVNAVSDAAKTAATELADVLRRSSVDFGGVVNVAAQELGRQGQVAAQSLSVGARDATDKFRDLAGVLEQRVTDLRHVLERLAPEALEAELAHRIREIQRRIIEAPDKVVVPQPRDTPRPYGPDANPIAVAPNPVSAGRPPDPGPSKTGQVNRASEDNPERGRTESSGIVSKDPTDD